MAERDDQERTEQPTQRRLDEARSRGNVPRSRELTMTAVMLAGAGALLGTGHYFAGGMAGDMRSGLSMTRDGLLAPDAMQHMLGAAVGSSLKFMAPVLLATFAAALLAPLAIGGWNLSFKAIAPAFGRLNPLNGFRRIFGVSGWVELLKALVKCVVIGGIAAAIVLALMDDTLRLGRMAPERGIAGAGQMICYALLLTSAALALIAAIDVPYQLWNYHRQLRMTRQEIRDELKETDGRPETRARVRNLQQQLARRRMLQQVPKADVVITNPTHYAVALKYESKRMRAPRVIARGADLVALAIRKRAEEHRVPVFESPVLARALYRSTQVGREIPAGLYVAVAQVLSYIYQVKAAPPQVAARLRRPEPEVGGEYLDS